VKPHFLSTSPLGKATWSIKVSTLPLEIATSAQRKKVFDFLRNCHDESLNLLIKIEDNQLSKLFTVGITEVCFGIKDIGKSSFETIFRYQRNIRVFWKSNFYELDNDTLCNLQNFFPKFLINWH